MDQRNKSDLLTTRAGIVRILISVEIYFNGLAMHIFRLLQKVILKSLLSYNMPSCQANHRTL